jgi:DNA-binding transcriptional ArsR family regulator
VGVTFSPANELVVSLIAYLCKKSHKRIELGRPWVKLTKSRLSSLFANELDGLDDDVVWRPVNLLIWQCPQNHSNAQFLKWFQDLSIGEIYEKLAPWIKRFPDDLSAVRDQLVYLLSEWDHQYFRHVEPEILSALHADAESKRAIQGTTNPIDFAEQVTNGLHFEPVEELKKIILIPQYHYQPANTYAFFGKSLVCEYSVDAQHLEEGEPSPSLYRLTRCIADKSRLRILRFLAKEPRSYIEVVRHMGLAKSTVYDHIINLRAAGLIRAYVSGRSITHYSLREESFDQLRIKLDEFIKS